MFIIPRKIVLFKSLRNSKDITKEILRRNFIQTRESCVGQHYLV